MTTNVASAATKTVADQSLTGMFGKASSQNSESGEFAQALTEADSDAETALTGSGDPGETVVSEPDGMPSAGRFKSLTNLTSFAGALRPASTASTGPGGATVLKPSSQQGQVNLQPQQIQQPQLQATDATVMRLVGDPKVPLQAGDPKASLQVADPKVLLEAKDPKTLLQVGDPKVSLKVANPKVLLDASDPKTLLQADGPKASLQVADPKVLLQTGDPKASLQIADPKALLQADGPKASLQVADPEMLLQTGNPKASLQPANPKVLLKAALDQQVPPALVEAQLPQQTVLKPVAQGLDAKTPAASSPLAKGEEILSDLDLTQLVPVLAGGKRAFGTPAIEGKGDARVANAQDETVDADQAEAGPLGADIVAAVPLDALSTAALSTEALLRLTSAPSAETSQDLAAMMPARAVEAPAAGEDLDPDDLMAALPADKNDGALDFLSSLNASSDVAEPASFRFQKAGDAVAVSLSMTKNEDGSAELQDSLPTTGKPETITVLDSRRYLGFGMGTNASSILSAASKNPDWAAAMHPASALSNAASASSTGNVVNTLKLQLNPENLGPVTANMRLVGEELSIHLTVHSSIAYRELSDDVKPMLDSLRAQGFTVDQVTVSIAPAADAGSNASGDQPQANTQTQQQLARDGEAARQQPQGQGQGRAANRSDRNDMENRNETAVEAGISRGNSSGDIYL
jgi:chemotaxis protein MotD